jgi:hypothetical protein
MSERKAGSEQYRWWLLDGDLDLVSGGRMEGDSLPAVLASVTTELDKLSESGTKPTNHPYRLIVCKGKAVVAVRPATVGIC